MARVGAWGREARDVDGRRGERGDDGLVFARL
jgi:hypothetical protein